MDELEKLIQDFTDDVSNLMELLKAKKITPQAWQREFANLIATYHQSAMMLGLGRSELFEAELAYLTVLVDAQLAWLENFELVVESAPDFIDGWIARAEMYADAIKTPYWKGKVEMLPLPAMPAQGSECLCITTPESRVLTARGLIPICDVVIGDEVLTHLLRWRKVTATPRNKPSGQLSASIIAPNGQNIGCTSSHKFLTPSGFRSVSDIKSSSEFIKHVTQNGFSEFVHLNISIGDELRNDAILYDITVDEDHSFFVEGLCTHNSNCGCSWEIITVDAEAGDYDAYWVRSKDDSCPTCLEREAQWNPIRIRGGMLIGV